MGGNVADVIVLSSDEDEDPCSVVSINSVSFVLYGVCL